MKTAIFLGAGASAAEGAPIQSELFRRYFKSRNIKKYPAMFKELSKFFKEIFGIDLTKPAETITFPTFEEALGILDLAEMRRESFRGFDFAGAAPKGNTAQLIRLYLILVMSKAIADGLNEDSGQQPHRLLVQNLRKGLLQKTIVISTNYDLVIDNALGRQINYGVDFAGRNNFGGQGRAVGNSVMLLKLHGSLNWLYCPVCNNLNSYESKKAVLSLMSENRPITQCPTCKSVMSPVIVPPTFYKDMSRVFLSTIWNKAENVLREVDHVVFCGYSLPDADMHIKYLLKRMQTNRPKPKSVRFSIFNYRAGKSEAECEAEEERYNRFFGKARVKYTRQSFEDFAKKPEPYFSR